MTTPEKIGSNKTEIISTELSDITVKTVSVEELPALKTLMEDNFDYFAKGGIISDSIYSMTESELGMNNSPNQRMGIWKDKDLIGYIGVNPSEDSSSEDEVEIAYAIDPKYARQGIAFAAIEAVTQHENDKGNTVIAEVEPRNHASMRLLGKLGFETSRRHNADGRTVFTRSVLTFDEMMRRLGM